MRITSSDLDFLDCMIKKYSCNLALNYKNIMVDQKTIAAVLKLLTPDYIADLLTVFTQDGLNLYVFHGLHKHLKNIASFTQLTFWNSSEMVP